MGKRKRLILIKGKLSPLKILTKIPQMMRNPKQQKIYQYYGKCGHSTDEYTTPKAPIKKGQIQQVQRIQERRRENVHQTRGERPN